MSDDLRFTRHLRHAPNARHLTVLMRDAGQTAVVTEQSLEAIAEWLCSRAFSAWSHMSRAESRPDVMPLGDVRDDVRHQADLVLSALSEIASWDDRHAAERLIASVEGSDEAVREFMALSDSLLAILKQAGPAPAAARLREMYERYGGAGNPALAQPPYVALGFVGQWDRLADDVLPLRRTCPAVAFNGDESAVSLCLAGIIRAEQREYEDAHRAFRGWLHTLKNRYEHAAERDALKRDLERLRTVPSLLLTRPEAVRSEQVGHAVRSCIEALLARKPSALRARTLFSMDGEVASGTLSIRLIDLIIDNLLDNALTHGRQDQPVTIGVHIDNGNLAIEVSSKGTFPPSVLQGTARGIGLRVATRAAERAKGSLILRNDNDRAVATYTQSLGATGSE